MTDTDPMTYVLVMPVLNLLETDWFLEERHEDELAQHSVMFIFCVI